MTNAFPNVTSLQRLICDPLVAEPLFCILAKKRAMKQTRKDEWRGEDGWKKKSKEWRILYGKYRPHCIRRSGAGCTKAKRKSLSGQNKFYDIIWIFWIIILSGKQLNGTYHVMMKDSHVDGILQEIYQTKFAYLSCYLLLPQPVKMRGTSPV